MSSGIRRLCTLCVAGFLSLSLALAGCAGAVTSSPHSSTTAIPLTLNVTSPQNGASFNVNLQKVMGFVSDVSADVQVNDNAAVVSPDGSFWGYVDLPKGESTIKVNASRGSDTASVDIAATFNPPLAIYLDLPQMPAGADYRVTPITVTGAVNYPQAAVTVDGTTVTVASDGTFTTQLMLKPETYEGGVTHGTGFSTTATLDGQTDSYGWAIAVTDTGYAIIAPGQGIMHASSWGFPNEIQIHAGESKIFEGQMQTRVDFWPSAVVSYSVSYLTSDTYSTNDTAITPLPDGLKATFMLPTFTLYPNVTYNPIIIIEAGPQVAPGTYSILIRSRGPWISVGPVRVIVVAPGSTITATSS